MRASFLVFGLALVACSGSSSSDVLAPAPATTSTVEGNDPAPPSASGEPNEGDDPEDVPPATPPSTKTPPATPATPAECDAFAAKMCAKADACNGIVATLLGADCTDTVGALCKAHLAAPGTGFTSAALAACGNAYGASTTCEDAFGAVQLAACNFKGALPLNAKCAFGDQCASGHCTGTAENACGTCATAPVSPPTSYVGLGEACDFGGSGPQCNTSLGLWCDSATKTCEPIAFAGIGQTCGFVGDDFVMCSAGGTCKWGSGGTGTCLAQKAVGAACTAASGYEECVFGATCIAGKCAYPTAAAICN